MFDRIFCQTYNRLHTLNVGVKISNESKGKKTAFLSAVGGEMRAESDVDIMVEFEPGVRVGLIKFESLAEELEVLAGRRVDLVTRHGLKPWVRPRF